MKRQNDTSQLRREEVEALDNDDSGEEAGVFVKANADVLAARRIVKTKR